MSEHKDPLLVLVCELLHGFIFCPLLFIRVIQKRCFAQGHFVYFLVRDWCARKLLESPIQTV